MEKRRDGEEGEVGERDTHTGNTMNSHDRRGGRERDTHREYDEQP